MLVVFGVLMGDFGPLALLPEEGPRERVSLMGLTLRNRPRQGNHVT